MVIKNVVFDVGNVLVRWAPLEIIRQTFPLHPYPEQLTQAIFKSDLWLDLNRGKMSEQDAIKLYHATLNIPIPELNSLMEQVKQSLLPIEENIQILNKLHTLGLPLYCITDNVHEIMEHLKSKYTFFNQFSGIVVSAELGILKPSAEIYEFLLKTYSLEPHESLFIDDHAPNIEGATKLGMHTIHCFPGLNLASELERIGIVLK